MQILRIFTGTLLALSITVSAFAQETRFFMPKEIARAYENGTRSYDGKPGPDYWQNLVDYDIDVTVIPDSLAIAGSERVTFHNNSPDQLGFLVIRLYHDVFRRANPRSNRVQESDLTDGVAISRLVVGGEAVDLSSVNRQGTNMMVPLSAPLPSGESLELEIDWSQKIPETTVRTGAYDSTSYFLAYWYPQVAVYDDIFGWDNLAYDFSTEFYNNLGNYDVRITAPTNFTVLSTGQLQNAEAILAEEQLERYEQAKSATATISIVGPEELEAGYRHQSGTWHYVAEEVSDFAFCLSDHHCWDAAAQTVDGRSVLIHSFYPLAIREQALPLTGNQQKMMKHFSEDIPGIPYPYPEFATYVSGAGGGGMEYPMMANNGGPGLGVTVHEMFHTYFPMYVRVNEKRFAWMDEGWADFTTSFLIRRFFEEDEETPLFASVAGGVSGTIGTISDLPLITSTQFMDNTNYGYASYPLPAFLYAVLYDELGEDVFLQCWREYIRRWAQKSPTPYDFFYTFEDVSGQDLSWFWKPWFFNYGNVDVQVESFRRGKLVVKNNGTRPVPLTIQKNFADGTTESVDFPASIWRESNTYTVKLPRYKEIEMLAVNGNVPDLDILDNYYPSLQAQYGDFTIPEDMLGEYPLNEFPTSINIRNDDGLLVMTIPGTGLTDIYLLPDDTGNFRSLDGVVQVQFTKEGDRYTGIMLQVPGVQVTGSKQE